MLAVILVEDVPRDSAGPIVPSASEVAVAACRSIGLVAFRNVCGKQTDVEAEKVGGRVVGSHFGGGNWS
jgi:hypothetical protein